MLYNAGPAKTGIAKLGPGRGSNPRTAGFIGRNRVSCAFPSIAIINNFR